MIGHWMGDKWGVKFLGDPKSRSEFLGTDEQRHFEIPSSQK